MRTLTERRDALTDPLRDFAAAVAEGIQEGDNGPVLTPMEVGIIAAEQLALYQLRRGEESPQEHIRNALSLLPTAPDAALAFGTGARVVMALEDLKAARDRLARAVAILERRVTP